MTTTTRLRKELRPLLFPWTVTMVAAAGYYLGSQGDPGSTTSFMLQSFAGWTFGFGCLALAALPFGSECQSRTLGLILSQPVDRVQLWKDKLLASILAIATAAAVHGAGYWMYTYSSVHYSVQGARVTRVSVSDLWSSLLLVVATTCSAAVWTLISRSTIGGAILTVAFQLFPYVVLNMLTDSVDESLLTALTMTYSGLMLWVGWRKFSTLELRDAPGTSSALPEGWLPSLSRLLRCRKQGVWLNLVRKELLLLRQLGQLSLIFIAGWLLLVVLGVFLPRREPALGIAFYTLHAVFCGLVALIAGSLAASEDRTLGVSAWQLTLPVAARRQWFVKLLTSAATAIVLAYFLPAVLVALRPFEPGTPFGGSWFPSFWPVGVIAFVISFWLASLGENVVHSAIGTIFMLIGSVILGGMAIRAVGNDSEGLQADLLLRFLSVFQLPPMRFEFIRFNLMLSVAVAPMLLALVQSRRQFQRVDVRRGQVVRHLALVAIVTLASAIWLTDLLRSEWMAVERLREELSYALPATLQVRDALQADRSSTQVLTIPAADLAKTDLLSPQVQEWLRNSTVTVSVPAARIISNSRNPGEQLLNPWSGERVAPGFRQLGVTFPNGTITYSLP